MEYITDTIRISPEADESQAHDCAREMAEYRGENIWGDLIWGCAGIDAAAIDEADPNGRSDTIIFRDGSRLDWAEDTGIWTATKS